MTALRYVGVEGLLYTKETQPGAGTSGRVRSEHGNSRVLGGEAGGERREVARLAARRPQRGEVTNRAALFREGHWRKGSPAAPLE